MPAVSRNQRIAAAIAEHEPDKLYARNKGMKSMTHDQLHDYAATKNAPAQAGGIADKKKAKARFKGFTAGGGY